MSVNRFVSIPSCFVRSYSGAIYGHFWAKKFSKCESAMCFSVRILTDVPPRKSGVLQQGLCRKWPNTQKLASGQLAVGANLVQTGSYRHQNHGGNNTASKGRQPGRRPRLGVCNVQMAPEATKKTVAC